MDDRFVLLVRGVNVGGVKLPMADLRAMLTGLELDGVRLEGVVTYIQSGNVVFRVRITFGNGAESTAAQNTGADGMDAESTGDASTGDAGIGDAGIGGAGIGADCSGGASPAVDRAGVDRTGVDRTGAEHLGTDGRKTGRHGADLVEASGPKADCPDAGPVAPDRTPADRIEAAIVAALKRHFGLDLVVFLWPLADYEAILAACPFQTEGAADGAKVHVVFHRALLSDGLDDHARAGERFAMTPAALYLHVPEGFGTSALVAKLPRYLKGAQTARNWRSCLAIRDLARGLP